MTKECSAPLRDELLIDYWAGDLEPLEAERIEEHLFACDDCAARLENIASVCGGVATLARAGRVSGIISRSILNRLQRDGVHVRFYSLLPGETVACAAFPDDDLVVVALRADLENVAAVALSVTAGPDEAPLGEIQEAPVSRLDGEVMWATPGSVVRKIPSTRVRLKLASTGASPTVLGEYVLDHSADQPTR